MVDQREASVFDHFDLSGWRPDQGRDRASIATFGHEFRLPDHDAAVFAPKRPRPIIGGAGKQAGAARRQHTAHLASKCVIIKWVAQRHDHQIEVVGRKWQSTRIGNLRNGTVLDRRCRMREHLGARVDQH